MSRFFDRLPLRVREILASLERNATSDPSFLERYHKGEVDENDRPIPRDSQWLVRIQSAILSSRRTACYGSQIDQETRSFLGGSPDLPVDFSWPTHMGAPLTFVAQLDLSELNHSGDLSWLPPTGRLLFFMRVLDNDGYDTSVSRVLYLSHVRPHNAQLKDHGRSYLVFAIENSYRPLGFEDWPVREDDKADLTYWHHNLLDPRHRYADWQVGGWPIPVQEHDMQAECESAVRQLSYSDALNAPDFQQEKSAWHLLGQFDREKIVNQPEGFSRGFFWVKVVDGQAVLDEVRLIGQTG